MKNQKGEAVTVAVVLLMAGMMIFGHGWGMRHGDHGDRKDHHVKNEQKKEQSEGGHQHMQHMQRSDAEKVPPPAPEEK